MAVLVGWLGPVAPGCGSSSQNARDFSQLPDRLTLATLSGPLCKDNACQCREPHLEPKESAGLAVDPGFKRFEFHIGPAENELWVTVDDMVLYKGRERASDCFYIDLATGKHPVKLRARGENGFAARLTISELGRRGDYDTFEFVCGGPGLCEMQRLKDWQASLAKYTRAAHDPCGSTKIRKIRWISGSAPDLIHPDQLELNLVLDVYEFEPKHPSGHPECRDKF